MPSIGTTGLRVESEWKHCRKNNGKRTDSHQRNFVVTYNRVNRVSRIYQTPTGLTSGFPLIRNFHVFFWIIHLNLLLCSKIDKKESKEKLEQRKKAKIDATDRGRMCENQGLFSDDTMHFVKLRSMARITNCQKIQSMTHLNKLRPSVWRAQTLARCERKKGGSARTWKNIISICLEACWKA